MDEIREEDSLIEQSMIVHNHQSTMLLNNNFASMVRNTSEFSRTTIDSIPSTPFLCIQAHNNDGICVNFNKSGDIVATGGDYNVKLWDTNSLCMTSSFSKYSKSVSCMGFSTDSNYLLTCSNDYQAKILKTNPLRVITFLNGHTDIINSCCFTNFT